MANELAGYRNGFLFFAVAEATYNPDPVQTITNTDSSFLFYSPLNTAIEAYDRPPIPRTGKSSYRGGGKSAAGGYNGTWSHECELTFTTLADTSSRPKEHPFLCAAGFFATATDDVDFVGPGYPANGGDNDLIVTYTLKDFDAATFSSARLLAYKINGANDEAVVHDIKGARCDFDLVGNGRQIVKLMCKGGLGIGTPLTKETTIPAVSYEDVEPYVFQGATMALVALLAAGDKVYGGGTESAPSMEAHIRSFSIAGNMPVVIDEGPGGTGGAIRARHNPSEDGITITITLEALTWSDDFDIYQFRDDATTLKFACVAPSESSANNLIAIEATGRIDAISADEDVDDLRVCTLTLAAAWPENGSDHGGLRPADNLTIKYVTLQDAP
jgi:hypothetical protein